MTYKISVDKETCIGCGACEATCEKFFKVGDDGKSAPVIAESEEAECIMEAAEGCPVNAIHVEKDGEKLI